MEPDDDTVEFLQQEKGQGWKNKCLPNVEETIEIKRFCSEGSDDELTKSEREAAEALMRS